MRFLIQTPSLRSVLFAVFSATPFALAMTPADLSARLGRNERLLVVDVRPAIAFADGHIPGAINVPASLLPHKPLPASQLVVVYGDGLGVVDEAKALATLRARPGLTAEVLEGGYAGWLAETRLSTSPAGVRPEKLPGITYDQLVAAGKGDVVLVDLRAPSASAPAASLAAGGDTTRRPATAASRTPDALDEFARKLGVPVVAGGAAPAPVARPALAASGEKAPARAAAPASIDQPGKLLVLVADDETAANEAARQLRARGIYRFTVLIGGTEAIRHEGRTGSGRMDGGVPVNPNQR